MCSEGEVGVSSFPVEITEFEYPGEYKSAFVSRGFFTVSVGDVTFGIGVGGATNGLEFLSEVYAGSDAGELVCGVVANPFLLEFNLGTFGDDIGELDCF